MIRLKTNEEIKGIRESCRRTASILAELELMVKPGIKTIEFDIKAIQLADKFGDKPSFLNYKPQGSRSAYPASLCVSVNSEIVHGLPGDYVLQEGDIVTLDMGLNHKGFFSDMAITIPVGQVKKEILDLINRTRESLYRGIEVSVVGNTTGDIGWAIESYLKPFGYGIIKDLAGHGVGLAVHEEPLVPNYGRQGHGVELVSGMVIAVEPMIALGKTEESILMPDEFTLVTKDGSISAHYEHTVAVTDNGPEILTSLN